MNTIYMALFIWLNNLHAKFLNNYIPEDVITKLTQIENTVESQLEIRKRNRYNEFFILQYQVKNENGHKEAYNIIEKYLNAYSCLHDKNEFCVTTLERKKNVLQYDNENKYFEFMQNVAKLYKQKGDQESVEYNNIQMYTSNRVLDSIRDKFALYQCIFIENCLVFEEDFALYHYNLNSIRGGELNRDYNHVFINLKFDSSIEKQNWFSKYPYKSFFDKHDFLINFKHMFGFRYETRIPNEFVPDETKNYFFDQLFYREGPYEITCGMERRGILEHCIIQKNKSFEKNQTFLKDIISNSYFLMFGKESYNTEFFYNLIEKSKKGELIGKNQLYCYFHSKRIEFLVLRCKKSIHLEEFPMNNDLFEIFLDIIIVKLDNTIIGEITIKYIAHVSDIDSFYMPAYMLPKYKEEIIGYETKFNVFLHEVKKYFSQSFSEYDENKRLCFNQ